MQIYGTRTNTRGIANNMLSLNFIVHRYRTAEFPTMDSFKQIKRRLGSYTRTPLDLYTEPYIVVEEEPTMCRQNEEASSLKHIMCLYRVAYARLHGNMSSLNCRISLTEAVTRQSGKAIDSASSKDNNRFEGQSAVERGMIYYP